MYIIKKAGDPFRILKVPSTSGGGAALSVRINLLVLVQFLQRPDFSIFYIDIIYIYIDIIYKYASLFNLWQTLNMYLYIMSRCKYPLDIIFFKLIANSRNTWYYIYINNLHIVSYRDINQVCSSIRSSSITKPSRIFSSDTK